MPTGGVLAAAAFAAMLYIAGDKVAHGTKRLVHQVGCIAKTAHKCRTAPQTSVDPAEASELDSKRTIQK